jgi:hypothetical protein
MSNEEQPVATVAPEPRGRRRVALAVTGAILAVIVAAAALSGTSQGRRVAASLGIRSQSEPYTAISFIQPRTLGSAGVTYHGIHVHDRISFRILNEEHRRIAYHWRLSFRPAWRTHRGSVTVGSGQTAVVTTRVLLPCNEPVGTAGSKPKRVKVRVQVSPSGDEINFWQRCGG